MPTGRDQIKYPIIRQGVFDSRQTRELNNILEQLKAHIDYKAQVAPLSSSAQQELNTALTAAGLLAAPPVRGDSPSSVLQTTNSPGNTVFSVTNIPNLPASKITSGTLSLSVLPIDGLYSNMILNPGIPIAIGTISVQDNDGNSHDVLVST